MLLTGKLRVLTKESVLYNLFQVIDIVDLTPILRENIPHANYCFLRKKLQIWFSVYPCQVTKGVKASTALFSFC